MFRATPGVLQPVGQPLFRLATTVGRLTRPWPGDHACVLYCGVRVFTFCSLSLHLPFTLRGKAIPLQAWTGPEGSRRLRLPDFEK
jgi:hypothetical protein